MTARYDVLPFDCYGTLIDWERGIGDAFESAARLDGVSLDRAALLRAYHDIEPVVQAERYRTYREVLTLTAQRIAERLGWPLDSRRGGVFGGHGPAVAPVSPPHAPLPRGPGPRPPAGVPQHHSAISGPARDRLAPAPGCS